MKAWVVEDKFGIDALKLVERETPKPGPGEVLVRVRAASLNYRDLAFVEGHVNPEHPRPLIPLSDAAGEVAAVGDGVTRVNVGDRVATHFSNWLGGRATHERMFGATPGGSYDLSLGEPHQGVLSEYTRFSAERLVHIPKHLSFEEGSTLPVAALTAWHALFLNESPLKAGETVLVQGTGGVATFALQLARAAGARVIVTSSSDEKLARAKELGAHEGINYKTTPAWDVRTLELTGGLGADLIVDVTGSELARSIRAVRAGGQVSAVGVLAGITSQVDLYPLLQKKARIQGVFVGSRDHFEDMNRAIEQHRLRPVIDHVFPFEKAREAFARLKSNQFLGKLVIAGA